jgi:hypothetical protein
MTGQWAGAPPDEEQRPRRATGAAAKRIATADDRDIVSLRVAPHVRWTR